MKKTKKYSETRAAIEEVLSEVILKLEVDTYETSPEDVSTALEEAVNLLQELKDNLYEEA